MPSGRDISRLKSENRQLREIDAEGNIVIRPHRYIAGHKSRLLVFDDLLDYAPNLKLDLAAIDEHARWADDGGTAPSDDPEIGCG